MDNLPAPTPNRQWFRLASIARMEALGQNPDLNPLSSFTSATPAPIPAAPRPLSPAPLSATPAPIPAAPRPLSPAPLPAPINPQPQPSEPPQSQPSTTKNATDLQSTTANPAPVQQIPPPLPTQPVTKPPSQTIRVPSRSPTPPQSPKTIKASTPNPSESLRVPQQLQRHPEPEPEPKMPVLPKLSSNSSNGVNTTDSSMNRKEQTASSWNKKNKSTENNENRTKVITMAGENTGAYFEFVPTRRGSNITKGEQYKGKVSEESNREGVKKEEGKPKRSVVNSNVQSVNNSILSGTNCTLQSPGVHIAFASRRQPKHKGAAESKSALPEN